MKNNTLTTKDTITSVSNMLSNEIYKGFKRGNPNFCPALIEPERFDRIQLQKKRNVRVRQTNRYYVFTGLVECTSCNHAMIANTRIDYRYEREYIGYRCNQYHNHRVCTHKKIINEPNLERLVLDSIKPAIQNYIARYEVQTSTPAKSKNDASKLKEKQNNLKELYINGYIEFEEFKTRCDELQNKIDSITVTPEPRNLTPLKDFLKLDIENIYNAFSPQEKRAFWASIINKIYLNDDNEIVDIDFLC